MQNYQRHSKPIIVCLNDSIFKDKHSSSVQKYQKTTHQKYENPQTEKGQKTLKENHGSRITSIQHLNGSYFGKTTHSKEPSGLGIFIDDQFNFFLSNWKSNNKMNGLTLAILLNGTKIYGTWVDGQPNGWCCIQSNKGIKIFIQLKKSMKGQLKIQSPILVIDEGKKITYLMEVQLSQSLYTKIQIISRKLIHQLFIKDQGKTFIDPKDIFEQMIDLKIPSFLSSFEDFLSHMDQNIQDVQVKEIVKDSQRLTFLSVKDKENINQKQLKPKCFIPFPQLLKQNEKQGVKSGKRLGILFSQKSYRIKAVGQFSTKCQLNGKGISTKSSSSPPLFGIFKSDMLVKQFQHPQPFQIKFLHCRQLKKQLTQHHMKSINFVHDFIYFHEVDLIMNLMDKIIQFVNVFQMEYSKRHGKEIDSFTQSQNQYEQGKYFSQQKNPNFSQKKKNFGDQNRTQEELNVFVKRKNSFVCQSTKKLRPFGTIVNSRSPLRQVPSHSKSPSEIETYRQRKPQLSPNISAKKSHQKDLMISINSFSNHTSNKYNMETMKNKQKDKNQRQYNQRNKKGRYFMAHNRQIQKQEDIMQTIRIKNESNIKSQYKRNSMQELTNNFYSRHLKNNYI